MRVSRWHKNSTEVGRWAAIAALFALPISVAAVNVFIAVAALTAILNLTFWRELASLWRASVVKIAIGLIVLLLVSCTYASVPIQDAINFALKEQKKLLLIPILIWLFRDVDWSLKARWALFSGLFATLIFSYVNYFGGINLFHTSGYSPDVDRAVVFKSRICQSFLTAFLFGMAMLWARSRTGICAKLFFWSVAALSSINVMLMMNGRSGQLAFLIMALFLAYEILGPLFVLNRRRALLSLLLGAGLVISLFVLASHQRNARINQIGQEIDQGTEGSAGQRLIFYKLSWVLIQERPLSGYGAGSLEVQAARLAREGRTEWQRSVANPHNEYLLMAVQTGIAGVLLFASLLWAAFVSAGKIVTLEGSILRAYVAIFAVGCCVNSLLLDFVEGHTFVLMVGIFLAPLYASRPHDQQGAEAVIS